MKDLAFLMITLGLIMVAMMAAQSTYRGQEAEKNRQWNRDRYQGPYTPPKPKTVSPTPTPSPET